MSKIAVLAKVLLFLVLALVFLITWYVYLIKPCMGNYLVVFDAGSTGTRGYRYEKKEGKFVLTAENKCRDNGLSAQMADGALFENKTYTDCFKGIMKEDVAPKLYNVQLRATGGMRNLCRRDQTRCDLVFYSIFLVAQSIGLPVQKEDFIALPGEQEATLLLEKAMRQTKTKESTTSSTAVMDLGGVSAQIAYELPKPNRGVYAYSSDCLGATVASLKIERLLIKQHIQSSNRDSMISHPCIPTGFQYPFIDNLDFEMCNPADIKGYPDGLLFIGSFDPTSCENLIQVNVLNNMCDECKVWNLSQLISQKSSIMFAVGSFSKSLGGIAGSDPVPYPAYKSYIDGFCHISKDSSAKDKKQQRYCFNMVYSTILAEATKISQRTVILRENFNISWIHGFVDNFVAENYSCTAYIIYLVCWGVIFTFLFIWVIHGCIQVKTQKKYTSYN